MKHSRASAFLIALALCFGVAAGALAQTAPRPLVPGAPAAQAPQPQVEPGEIRVNRLNAPGRAAAGLLTEEGGGLAADLWQGSDRRTIVALFQRLPDFYSSPAARTVARKLLLSTGAMPEGPVEDQTILALRLNGLLRLGDQSSVVALAEAAGGDGAAPEVAAPLVDALFLLNDMTRACALVQGQVRQGAGSGWQKAGAFCDLQAGRIEEAELTLSLLRETGDIDEPFSQLVAANLDGTKVVLKGDGSITALHLAFLRVTPSATLDSVDGLPAHFGAALARLPGLVAPLRVAAGASAIRRIGSPAAPMTLLLSDPAVSTDQEPLRDRVLAAVNAGSPAVRAEAIRDVWNDASATGDQGAAAAYLVELMNQTLPAASMAFLAPAALRIALLNGRQDLAQGWYDMLQRVAAGGQADMVAARTAAIPLTRIAGLAPADDRNLKLWLDSLSQADPEAGRDQALSRMLLLDGLGLSADEEIWQGLLDGAPVATGPVDLAIWRQMVMASGGNRKGEALLAALVLIGAGGPAELDMRTLPTVVGALRRAGLAEEARQLAIEAVIAQGG